MTRLDARTQAARDLAHANSTLGALNLDATALQFTTEQDRVNWQAGLTRARREITRAELAIHDLIFEVPVQVPERAA